MKTLREFIEENYKYKGNTSKLEQVFVKELKKKREDSSVSINDNNGDWSKPVTIVGNVGDHKFRLEFDPLKEDYNKLIIDGKDASNIVASWKDWILKATYKTFKMTKKEKSMFKSPKDVYELVYKALKSLPKEFDVASKFDMVNENTLRATHSYGDNTVISIEIKQK